MSLGAIFFITLLLSISFISAAPPFQTSTPSALGIQIESPVIEYIQVNEDFNFHVHAHNATSGLLLTNETASCTIHVYSGPDNGIHIIETEMEFDASNLVDFEYTVLGGNFSEPGQYAVLFYCEVPDEIGGFFEQGFYVTKTGQSVSLSNSIIVIALFGLALILLTISFFFQKEYWMFKMFFQFMAVGAGLIAVNSAKIIASESDAIGKMGNVGLLLMIVVLALFFLWMFVNAFKEIIKIFKEKGELRWKY